MDTDTTSEPEKTIPAPADVKTAEKPAPADKVKATAASKPAAAASKPPMALKPSASEKPTAAKTKATAVKTKATAAKKPATAAKKPSAAKKPAAGASKAAAKKPSAKAGNKAVPKRKRSVSPLKKVNARDLDDEYGLKLFFQPVFYPSENRVYGYECLLRIVDQQLGVITPDVFLGVAQKNASLMRGLEEWSLSELFRTARLFREKKKYIEMLSLNIDTNNFFKKDFYGKVSRYFEKITENIVFELKEDAFFSADPVVADTIEKLRLAGIKIAVDDFTANFLTFEWGETLPFDMIKIERTYIDRLLNSPKAHLIVEKILSFAKERGLDVIAVGVENAEQEAELMRMGVDKMQGYYYAKPLQMKRLLSD